MFELILENANGDQLTFSQNSPFTVVDIDGLNPPDATINTSQLALIDGAKFNSSKLEMRQIEVAFAIEYQAAKNRIEVYKVLKSKQYVKLYYNGDYRKVFIEGYISGIDISYFEMKQIVTCSILCPSPYFKEAEQIVSELLNIINMFHFPFHSTVSKNLLQNTAASTEMNGITFTVNEDGSVTVDGTATASAYLAINADLDAFMRIGESYVLSGCPEGGSVNGYRLQLWYNGIGAAGYDIGEGVTIIPDENITTANVAVYINSGVTVDDLTFYPMIRLADISDDTYEEYGKTEGFVFGYISNDIGITIDNAGDVECGMIITLNARDAITNPKIFNYVTQDYFGLNFSMQKADQITIDTRQGEKTVTLLRGGVKSNIFNSVIQGSTWLQLSASGSTFVYEVQSGSAANLAVSFSHFNLYEGV